MGEFRQSKAPSRRPLIVQSPDPEDDHGDDTQADLSGPLSTFGERPT